MSVVDVPVGAARRRLRSRRSGAVCVDASAYACPVTNHVYATPEAAALSSYSPAAGAHVVRTEVIDDEHVDVIVDFASSHPMRCHCMRTIDGWIEAGDIVE